MCILISRDEQEIKSGKNQEYTCISYTLFKSFIGYIIACCAIML
jgi:hypothetical protein